jgi:hypothetical protein
MILLSRPLLRVGFSLLGFWVLVVLFLGCWWVVGYRPTGSSEAREKPPPEALTQAPNIHAKLKFKNPPQW